MWNIAAMFLLGLIDDQLIEILNGISKDEIIVVDATKNDKLSS